MKRKIVIVIIMAVCICQSVLAGKRLFYPKEIYNKNLWQNLDYNLEIIHSTYPDFTELKSIGNSVNRKKIKALKIGKGKKSILINGAHHAREMMTTVLCVEQARYLADEYNKNEAIRKKLDTVAVWFVPLVNPDGVAKALTSHPGWKANARGVDLNRNYPTRGLKNKVFKPASQGYHGPYPFSEPETSALRDFCYEQNFETAIAYHSAGEVIYWWFYQQGEYLEKSKAIARTLSHATGYSLVPTSKAKGGYGFTDWFISEFNKPAFTLEIGKKANGLPLPFKEYERIWKYNKKIPMILVEEIMKVNHIKLTEPQADAQEPSIDTTTSSIIKIETDEE